MESDRPRPAAIRPPFPSHRPHGPGLAALAVAALLACGPGAAADDGGDRYALLIGVSAYEQWVPLANPVPDVRAFGEELRSRYGFRVEVVEDPDRATILGKLRRYSQMEYGPDDQLLVAFAGHGTYDEVTGIGYLAARNSATRKLDPNFDTLLDYPRLVALVDAIPSRQVMVVVDACYSGSLLDTRALAAPGVSLHGAEASRSFLTSGGTEYVPDGHPEGHTPFMGRLLAALRSTPPGRALSFERLVGEFMSELDPRPRWGSGGAGFEIVAGTGGSAPPPVVTAAAPAAIPAPPPPAAEPRPRLRRRAAAVAEPELEAAFRRGGLFEAEWSPEGDFPNQLREQTRDLWSVVLDLESGLTWQRSGSDRRMTFAEALDHLAWLNRSRHAGHSDWRLPTLEELASILEPVPLAGDLHLDPLFDSEQETCWSSDSSRESGNSYFLSFMTGRAIQAYGDRRAFVRAVRND